MKIYISLFALMFVFTLNAQINNSKTESFFVNGNCEMCQFKIEKASTKNNISKGNWDMASKILVLKYDSLQTNPEIILQKIADVGHDNEMFRADDEVYKTLSSCCLYERVPLDEISTLGENHTENNHSHDDLISEEENYDDEHFHDLDEDLIQLEAANISKRVSSTEISRKNVHLSYDINSKELLKAACCNLSESFETNSTVDVSFSNAITGTKQLKMLGLDQKYTALTKELLPEIRGLASAYGLNFIPGRWIGSIQLTKGGSSVSNGYESITGQINTELLKLHDEGESSTEINFFGNSNTRFEGNIAHQSALANHWNQSILLHADATLEKKDHNDDGFLDIPIGKQFNIAYLINYNGLDHGGLATHFGLNVLYDSRIAGQKNFKEDQDKFTENNYGVGIDITRFQAWNKTGYIFDGKPYQSIGLMNQFTYHEQKSYFGMTPYNGTQITYYANLIFESIIGNSFHKYKTGASFLYDKFDENYNYQIFERTEKVPGLFFEYTFSDDKIALVAGARVDFHNLAGTQFTPRINFKYDITPKTILRLAAGRGFRTANVFAENQQYFTSNREVIITPNNGDIYGLKPEVAWNYGISLQQDFRLFRRKSSIIIDFFRTDFSNQVVTDLDHSTHQILFYNLEGDSYANSLQAQWEWELVTNFNLRLAYKYYDVKTEYTDGKKKIPFMATHRGFLNLAYETKKTEKGKQWTFDTTLQYVGKQRIPDTSSNPEAFRLPENSDDYVLWNAQIAHLFSKNIRLYAGVENILSYKQKNPILEAENPFGNYFDGSMIYAPIMPADFYLGIDFKF